MKHTYVNFKKSLSKPVNLSSQNALVISLALSGLKLKKITESPSFTNDNGWPFSSVITVGNTNSSVLSFAYESSTALTASVALTPSPVTNES